MLTKTSDRSFKTIVHLVYLPAGDPCFLVLISGTSAGRAGSGKSADCPVPSGPPMRRITFGSGTWRLARYLRLWAVEGRGRYVGAVHSAGHREFTVRPQGQAPLPGCDARAAAIGGANRGAEGTA